MAKPFDDLRKQMSPERREKNRQDAERELVGIEDCVNPSKGFHDLSFNQLAERVHALACIMAVVDGPMPTREELDLGHDEAMAIAGLLFEAADYQNPEAEAIHEQARAQIQTLEKKLNDARQTALMLATKIDRDRIPEPVHTKLDLWETEPIAELARMVDGPRQPEGLPDPKDCAPPWTAFYVDGYPEAIMPAGRPGDVAIVRGLPEELVQRIIDCANAGELRDRLKPGEVEAAIEDAKRLLEGSKQDSIIQDFLEKTAPKERECTICGDTYTGLRIICGKRECEVGLQMRVARNREMRPIDYQGDNAPRGAIFFNDYTRPVGKDEPEDEE
jgi:hypothetical protein